jgi:hypothetical protein
MTSPNDYTSPVRIAATGNGVGVRAARGSQALLKVVSGEASPDILPYAYSA